MGIPQIILLTLIGINLLIRSNNHLKEIKKTENIWLGLLDAAIIIGLLVWGGFFK